MSQLPVPVRERHARRWQLLRDLAVFQLKIFLDGLKDLILAPVGLLAGLVGLIAKRGSPERYLFKVMRAGKSYEEWINLYGALDHDVSVGKKVEGLDEHLKRLEQALVIQCRTGGLTNKARQAVETALDALAESNAAAGPDTGEPGKPERKG